MQDPPSAAEGLEDMQEYLRRMNQQLAEMEQLHQRVSAVACCVWCGMLLQAPACPLIVQYLDQPRGRDPLGSHAAPATPCSSSSKAAPVINQLLS